LLYSNVRSRSFGALATITALTLQGCSLINPHVSPDVDRPVLYTLPTSDPAGDAVRKSKSPPAMIGDNEFAGGIAEAINYANAYRTAYYDAVGDQSTLTNGIALTAIPASAAALYFGISGEASRNVIAGLATGVAGLVGVGAFLESDDRQRVYLAGHRAIGCIILGATPLIIPKKEFETFRENLETIGERQGPVQVAKVGLSVATAELRAEDPAHPTLTAADLEVAVAEQLLESAASIEQQAQQFAGAVETSGVEVVTRVDTVTSLVSDQITRTEPSIAAITEITSSLQGVTGRVATIPAAKPPKNPAAVAGGGGDAAPEPGGGVVKAAATPEEKVAAARGALAQASADLAAALVPVRNLLLAHVSRAQVLGKMQDCAVADAVAGIEISPADTVVSLQPGSEYNILISGGKRPYSASLVGGSVPEGVKLVRSGFDQQPVVATVSTDKEKSKAGAFAVAIADATGEGGRLINFTIASPPVDVPAAPAVRELSEYEGTLGIPQVMVVQAGANLDGAKLVVDGVFGEKTRLHVKEPLIDEDAYKVYETKVSDQWDTAKDSFTCDDKTSLATCLPTAEPNPV
jgi:hypothetical protein